MLLIEPPQLATSAKIAFTIWVPIIDFIFFSIYILAEAVRAQSDACSIVRDFHSAHFHHPQN